MRDAANLLGDTGSPYLLQHAGNPVHWRPWGAAALAEARETGRPILLSIGYAACHWCHVMAHESFEDAETAALMNTRFVNIKVDREERPDIDQYYMSALHALGEQGGWPLTMFLDPDGAAFWGGTYFPPEPRWGRPSFRQVLAGIADAVAAGDRRVLGNIGALRHAIGRMGAPRPGDLPGPALLDGIGAEMLRSVDPHLGGMGGAPKFPNAPLFRFFWQQACHTGQTPYADAVHGLLRAMSQGGIYDHLGGGYARYSTDAEWLVPHFEKMLYDTAQILDLLALAQAAAPDPLYAARAAESVGWLRRDMAVEQGGLIAFGASEDADSEGEEGRFYVWTAAEIEALLGDEATAFARAYDVTPAGNWEERTILRRVTPRGDAVEEAALARSRDILLQARAARVRPGRDDKVLADWNGMTIAALVRAAAVFDRPDWLDVARGAYRFVMRLMRGPDGRVQHAWRQGRVTAAGLLDDQACMARAAIALHEMSGEAGFLEDAAALAQSALDRFRMPDGGYAMTADDVVDLPDGRPRNATDNATPAGTGIVAEVFARLHHLTGEARWRAAAEAVLRAHGGAGRQLSAMPTLLNAARVLDEAVTVTLTGSGPTALALAGIAARSPDPALCIVWRPDRVAAASAILCRTGVCGLPVTTPAALQAALRQAA